MKRTPLLLACIALSLSIVTTACGSKEMSEGKGNSPFVSMAPSPSTAPMASTESSASPMQSMMPMKAAKMMGNFEGQNGMKVTGSATIEDGQLMLTGFSTSEGPDLHVYLAKGMEVSNGIEISKIDLKKMEQTFDVSKADIAAYDTVLIYCQKAHVIFGAAMLQ